MSASAWLSMAWLAAVPTSSEYPLAAAFAVGGKAVLVEVHGGVARELPTPGLEVWQADLSRNRKHVVLAAREGKSAPRGLFLLTVETAKVERLATGLEGALSDPRFTPDGAAILFSASGLKAAGPTTPTKLWRYTLATKKVEGLAHGAALCSFAPADLGAEVLHVGSNCYSDSEVLAVSKVTGKSRPVGKVAAPTAEVATAFDGKTAIFTSDTLAGTTVWLVKGGEKPRVLALLEGVHGPLQPRFACPRDVLLSVGGGAYSVLNSATGEVTSASAPCALDGGLP